MPRSNTNPRRKLGGPPGTRPSASVRYTHFAAALIRRLQRPGAVLPEGAGIGDVIERCVRDFDGRLRGVGAGGRQPGPTPELPARKRFMTSVDLSRDTVVKCKQISFQTGGSTAGAMELCIRQYAFANLPPEEVAAALDEARGGGEGPPDAGED